MSVRPVFYLFSGLTASGKTVLARTFASSRSLAYVDYDTLVQPMLRAIERQDGVGDSRAAFYRKWREPCYEGLWDICAEILGCGSSLAASAPCGNEVKDPEFFSTLKKKAGVDFKAVGIYLAPESSFHLEAMKRRNAIWNEDIIPDWENYRRLHSPQRPVWDADVNIYLEYNSFDNLNAMFENVLKENGL